jgi:hypothetical protein
VTEAKEEELEEEAEWIYNGAFLKPSLSLQVSEERVEEIRKVSIEFCLAVAGGWKYHQESSGEEEH